MITYHHSLRRPKVAVTRTFVGVSKLVQNAWAMLRSTWSEIAYDEHTEIIDPGDTRSVHWAIQVDDPWDTCGRTAVYAQQVEPNHPCAVRYEVGQVVRVEDPPPPVDGPLIDEEEEEPRA